MSKHPRALARGSRGQSLVEFAMVLPLLLVVGFIITEFGRALWIKNVLTEAAGNAARAAIVTNVGTYVQVATDRANVFLVPNNMSTTQETDPSVIEVELLPPDNGAQVIRVRISRQFNFVPGQGDGGEMAPGPFATGDRVGFGSFTIVGEARMDTQPAFGF
jgi:hypothetical protein